MQKKNYIQIRRHGFFAFTLKEVLRPSSEHNII